MDRQKDKRWCQKTLLTSEVFFNLFWSTANRSWMYYTLDTGSQDDAYSIQWICSPGAYMPKKFLASWLLPGYAAHLICAVVLLPSCLWPSLPMRTRKATGVTSFRKKKTFLGFGKVLERLNLHGLKIYNTKSNNLPCL